MKFQLSALLVLLSSVSALAGGSEKQIIVSYPKDTPAAILDEAMDAIKQAGGTILHEYNLFKGFAAKAPAKVMESIQTLGSKYNVLIEDDQTVSVQESI